MVHHHASKAAADTAKKANPLDDLFK